MSVGIQVGSIITEIGSGDFLHAFFSTISYHLEPNGWGTNYPELMKELYQGKLPAHHVQKVLKDIKEIHEKLKSYSPDKVIWDIEDLKKQPPWGKNISPKITDLSNYFVTSTGRDVFQVLIETLEFALKKNVGVTITGVKI